MTSREAIAKFNVLSSYETSKEKREEYKECIYAILKDVEISETLKKHIIIESRIGMGTERYKDIKMNIIYEDDDNGKVLEWLEKCKRE